MRRRENSNFETARAHAAKIASGLAKETSYEGVAVSVTDEEGNEVAYVPIGEAATEAALIIIRPWALAEDHPRPCSAAGCI